MTSKLFKHFAGTYKQFILKSIKGSQVMDDGTRLEGSVVLEGFLLDEDDDYYFIGDTQEAVSEAIRRDDVVRIFEPDAMEGIFESTVKNGDTH